MSRRNDHASLETPSFVSLYSGAGGLDLGFIDAGFVPVFANDIDAHAVETYNRTMKRLGDRLPNVSPSHRAVRSDIRELDVDFRSLRADYVIGGPPCQGFSIAGRMDRDDPRSRHVFDFMRVVELARPRGFVMENVKALAVNRRWAQIRNELNERAEALGYNTALYVLNSADYGVPQARERMFFVGLVGDDPVVPPRTTSDSPPTVRSVLETLPDLGQPGNDRMCTAKIAPAKKPVLRKSPYAGMLFNGQGRPLDLDQPSSTLPASMGGNRTPIIDQHHLVHDSEPWIIGYHDHLMAGGDPISEAPSRLRRLSVDEAAAIQTFSNEVEWSGPQSAQFRQIGNAVPPALSRAVALSLIELRTDTTISAPKPPRGLL